MHLASTLARLASLGRPSTEADAVAHMVCVVALLAGSGGNASSATLLNAVATTIKVTQNTADAVAFGSAAARIFEKLLIFNITVVDAITATAVELEDPNRTAPNSEDGVLAAKLRAALASASSGEANIDFVLREGQSCDYPHTLPNVAQLVASLGAAQADWVSGARQNILAGGDSGSRGVFVGALQGARLGSASALPSDWVAKTTVYATVAPLAAQLVSKRA